MGRSTKNEAKAAQERQTFATFIRIAGLDVVPNSIESREPPEPDILCSLGSRGPIAFELVDLVDQDWAHNLRTMDPDNPRAIWVGDTTATRIRDKLFRRKYSSVHPMELVAYEGSGLLLPDDVWQPTYRDLLVSMRESSPFRRIWVVDLADETVRFVDPGLRG